MDYTGLKCPVCGKPFTSDDDIVVCPECGAPYHRACYQQAGHCIFQEKHGTPDAWKPPEKQTETGAEGKICPRCGKKNARESLFCDQCGQLLSGGTSKGASPNGGYSPYGTPNPNASPYQNPGVPNPPPYQNPARQTFLTAVRIRSPSTPWAALGRTNPLETASQRATWRNLYKPIPNIIFRPLSTGSATIGTGSIFPRFSVLAVGCFTANNINGAPFSRGLCC